MLITPEYRRGVYLRCKERAKLRAQGLLEMPFKAKNDEERRIRKNTLQCNRRKAKALPQPVKVLKPIVVKPPKETPIPKPIVIKPLKKPPKIKKKKQEVEVKKFKTIKHDITKMVEVEISDKLTVYVKKGRNIEQVKLKYKEYAVR